MGGPVLCIMASQPGYIHNLRPDSTVSRSVGEGTAGALRERVAVIVCESLHCPPDDRRLTWLFHLISLDIAEWFVLMIAIVSCVLS